MTTPYQRENALGARYILVPAHSSPANNSLDRAGIRHPQPPQIERQADTMLDLIAEALGALRRRWYWIAGSTFMTVAAALAFLMLTRPLYMASVQLLIDPRAKQVLETEVVPSGFGSSSLGADTLLVDSQIEIIRSDPVLGPVVESEGLADHPEFAKVTGNGLGALIVGIGLDPAPGIAGGGPSAQTPDEAALEMLRKRLDVYRTGNTYIIDIDAWSQDPQMAARLANAVGASYLREDRDMVRASTREATAMLGGRLEELRTRLNEADNRVEAYREEHDLIGIDNLLVSEQQLRDLNDRLTTARNQTSEARSRYESLVNASEGEIGAAGMLSTAITSETISGLRVAYGDVVRRLESISATLGPSHPSVKALTAERQALGQSIAEELDRLASNALFEYDTARAHEKSLSEQVRALEQLAGKSNQSEVTLRQLQREADAARTVYESFLVRTQQTAEQEDISVNNARIISAATAPTRYTYPRPRLIGVAAVLFGLALGCVLAWGHHIVASMPHARPVRRLS